MILKNDLSFIFVVWYFHSVGHKIKEVIIMALMKWKPFGELDKLFDDDFPAFSFPTVPKIGWDLAVDMYEENGNLIAKMNLPGIDPEKVEVSVDDDYLRISGAREEEKETEKKDYYKEIKRGSFERSVPLPSAVKRDKIEASCDDGVLKIVLPKANGKKEETVKIK